MSRHGATSALVDLRVLRWSIFDVASSTFAAVVPTFFGLYFVAIVAPTHPGSVAVWGFVVAAALVVAGTLAPVTGAVADRTGRWLTVLSAMTAACVGLTLLLPLAHGRAFVACGSFLLALIAYTLATNAYDSLLVRIAPVGRRGLASGIGWALGLCGGLVAIATALAVVHDLPASAQIHGLPSVFMSTGLLFGLLAIPALLALRGLRTRGEWKAVSRSSLGESVGKVMATLREWRRHRRILRVLASFFLINDVLVTLQFFLTIMLSTRYGLTVEGLLKLSLIFHAIAIPSTIVAGALADHWGGRRTVVGLSAILAAALLLMALSTAAWVPLAAVSVPLDLRLARRGGPRRGVLRIQLARRPRVDGRRPRDLWRSGSRARKPAGGTSRSAGTPCRRNVAAARTGRGRLSVANAHAPSKHDS